MPWNISSLGIGTIDARNLQLLEKAEAFRVAYENHRDSEMINLTLNDLESCVIEHFKYEEALQMSKNYPKFNEHKTMHNSFIEDLAYLKSRLNEDGVPPFNMKYFADVLVRWIIDHIDGTDVEFVTYYRSISRNFPAAYVKSWQMAM